MQAVEVEALLKAGLENCEIEVQAQGNHFDILAIGDVFAGLRPVQKQQMVYGILRECIADGSIHAVNIRTFTPAEWQARTS